VNTLSGCCLSIAFTQILTASRDQTFGDGHSQSVCSPQSHDILYMSLLCLATATQISNSFDLPLPNIATRHDQAAISITIFFAAISTSSSCWTLVSPSVRPRTRHLINHSHTRAAHSRSQVTHSSLEICTKHHWQIRSDLILQITSART
jgi:hypothetical protein